MISGQIDLWRFSLNRGVPSFTAALAMLDADERTRFHMSDCSRLAGAFAIRRSAQRIILSKYLNVEPNEVVFTAGPFGKPRVDGLHFNASHSSDYGCLAVSRISPVGVDIERLRDVGVNLLVARILSSAERRELQAMSPDSHAVQIFAYWTGKEAVIKGIGRGLELSNLPLITLPPSPGCNGWSPVKFAGRMREHGDWSVFRPEHPPGYHITLASKFEVPVTPRDGDELLAQHEI